ncbi:hypothetical protein G6O69_00670 [Pseudenhygromyxa sp. WMMC2535]|uniref:protein-arginine deiminase family protein n=1 Tax=Pseudenhygromyxa sp. WMMC2535 TaxID=2712867 RepID=UPI001556E080|nr:protein-arginine deiminase family protein [Pseudenhygromyxa sp. WMMC2535]NVB36323.1 hypothetical protein [Pseudenhygromyxa sp. WMMC2535]
MRSDSISIARVLACASWLLTACSDDGGGGGDEVDTGTGESAEEGSEAESGEGNEGAETGDAGDTGDTGDTGEEAPPGLYGVPNLDDDDQNGQADWDDPAFDADNDLTDWSLPEAAVEAAGEGGSVELLVEGDVDQLRFWLEGEAILGQVGADEPVTSVALTGAQLSATLQVEFGDFHRWGTITARSLDAGGVEVATLSLEFMASPLVINHHGQPTEYVWAVPAGSNSEMIAEFEGVLGDRFVSVSSNDVWIQDELEWATATAPDKRLNIAMDSIRDRALDSYVKGLEAPDIQPMTWGQAGTDVTEDKFGNLEVTMPVSAGGVDYPFGRIYYGDKDGSGPNEIIKSFLDEQALQAPIRVDTTWLCIGHVDEFLSFIPDPDSARGFKFLITDTNAAWELLEAMDPSTSLPRYAQSHGYATVASMLDDDELRATNDDVQANYLDAVREQLEAELDLDPEDIIRIPGLFERLSQCPYSAAPLETAALIPGMLNLVVVNLPEEPLRIFVSDPFMRTDTSDQGSDPFIAAFADALPSAYEIHHVDDWYTYHVYIGEVHCGSNVSRTPTDDWWQDGMHLLGEQ